MVDKYEEAKRLIGEILSTATGLELDLEFCISNYFVKPQNQKTFFFRDEVLVKMNFDRKVQIFEEMCKREGFDKVVTQKTLEAMRHVQKIRNNAAHWQAEIFEHEDKSKHIRLRARKSRITPKDVMKLDENLIAELKRKAHEATEGIIDLYLKYDKEGTIDEKPYAEII